MKSFNKCKLCPFNTTKSMASFRRSIKSCQGSFKVSNISLILVLLLVFETKIYLSQQINENQIIKQYVQENDERYWIRQQCFVGFKVRKSQKNLQNSHEQFVQNNLYQRNYQDFLKIKDIVQWQYCLIKEQQKGLKDRILFYSEDERDCMNRFCATIISQQQCYFKALLKQKEQSQNMYYDNSKIYLRRRLYQQNTNNQAVSPKITQADSNINNDQNNSLSTQVVMIILLCIFGVPFSLLLFFAILTIIRLCRNRSRPTIQVINNPNPTQSLIIQQINIDNYKLDQVGPYHINFLQQCPICLDQNVNIRTQCGHYYHPQCIKAWLIKGKHRCPVCNCTKLNPMKVYCKKCSVGVKILILNGLTSEQFITQTTNLVCQSCQQDDKNSDFSPTPRKQPSPLPKGQPKRQPKRQLKQQPIDQPIEQPRRGQINQAQVNVRESVEVQHNQNQNQIESLDIRQSSNQLRQNVR